MASEKKEEENVIWNFVKNHWGEAFTLYHVFLGGRSADVPEHLQPVVDGLRGYSRQGGKDSLEDERYFQDLIDQLEDKFEKEVEGITGEQARDFLVGWLMAEFPTDSRTWSKRKKAVENLELFRMTVCGMDRDPVKTSEKVTVDQGGKGKPKSTTTETTSGETKRKALGYLVRFTTRIISAYKHEVEQLGKQEADLTDKEKSDCERRAYKLISKRNRARGMPHMPTASEKHWTDHVSTAHKTFAKYAEQTPDAIRLADQQLTEIHDAMMRKRPQKGPGAWLRNWIS